MTTYHVDLPAEIASIVRLKAKFTKPPHTAWTAIDVDRLLPDGGLTEIKITAYAPLSDH